MLGSQEGASINVTDVVPLFHERVMQGPLEIAFDLVSSCQEKQIVGIYEALAGMVHSGEEESGPHRRYASPLAATILETIKTNFPEALIFSIRNPEGMRDFGERFICKPLF